MPMDKDETPGEDRKGRDEFREDSLGLSDRGWKVIESWSWDLKHL